MVVDVASTFRIVSLMMMIMTMMMMMIMIMMIKKKIVITRPILKLLSPDFACQKICIAH